MKIAITGGTGFVGQKLSLELLRQGHKVVILSRNRAKPSLPVEVRTIPESHIAYARQLEDVDQIIHLAGESVAGRWNELKKEKIYDSRILGTLNLMKAINELQIQGKSKVKRVIMASAIGFYGDRGEQILTEDSTPGADFLAKVCVDWEKALFDSPLEYNLERIAFRLGIVLERNGGVLEKLLPLFRTGAGSAVGDGEHGMSWIHLDDVVRAFVWAVEGKGQSGVYNVVAPGPIKNKDFSEILGDVIGKPVFLPPTPKIALKLALGEMSQVVLSSQFVQPKRLMEAGFEYRYSDLRRALESICACEIEGHDEFSCTQWVPRTVPEVFAFFSSEKNLEKITPPWVNFQVLRKSTPTIEKGTLIDYRLRIHGVPASWTTRIDDWVPNSRFVDTQITGPYDHWWHLHTFEELNGGTLMTDRVRFRVPLGLVGRAVAGGFVRNDVKRIFAYRTKVIGELFSS